MLGLDLEVGGGRLHRVAEDDAPVGAPGDHQEDAGDEDVRRDGEEGAGLLHPAQVHQGEQHDDRDRGDDLVLDDEGDGRAEVLDARGDRDGDGQDVVDEQGARHGEPGLRPEVGGGHLVVAAAARVGVHVLPVGGDDREHQDDDRERDPGAEVVGRQTGYGEDEQHLAGCVRHRGQRVGGEDGEGDPLREEGLAELVAAQGPPDQDPFGHVGQFGHGEDRKRSKRATRTGTPDPHGISLSTSSDAVPAGVAA